MCLSVCVFRVYLFSFLFLCVSVSCVLSQGRCGPFQVYSQSKPAGLSFCTSYQTNSCCDSAASKRAYNWAAEDDGCGVVSGTCLRYLRDIGCMVNCAVDLPIGIDADLLAKPIICDTYARQAYSACISYSWCGVSQMNAASCQYLRTYRGYKDQVSQKVTNRWDTCTWVGDLEYGDFARRILRVMVAPANSTRCVTPKSSS